MEKLFLTVLNMSLTGAFVIAAIILARLPLKRAPKAISYALWAVAGFRLVFPFSIESIYSLMPLKAQTIPLDIATQPVPHIDSGMAFVNNAVSSVLPAATPYASANPLQIWLAVGSTLWLLGMAAMLIYSVVSILLLKHRLRSAAHAEGNLYEADNLKTPFVIGFFRPKIYIPAGLSGEERRYIILHEQTHIRRHDHIVKMLAYFILCLHWFNPLAWAAFILMGTDMEMSCDERVMKDLGEEIKRDYSRSLVRVASGRKIINGSPLAFGEGGMKGRVKNVLNFKTHSRVIIVAAVALVAVLSVGFAVNSARITGDEIEADARKFGSVSEDWDVVMEVSHGIGAVLLCDAERTDSTFAVYVNNGTVFEDYHFRRGGSTVAVDYGVALFKHENAFALISMNTVRAERIELTDGETIYLDPSSPFAKVFSASDEVHLYNEYGEEIVVPCIDWGAGLGGSWVKTYFLDSPTDRERLERMLSVTLYDDGSAQLATPPISSYLLPPCAYSFEENELVIYANIESSELEGAYGVKSGDAIAVFTVDADGALVFKSAAVPLFADEGARYIPAASAPATDFVTREWVGYDKSEDFWTTTADLMLDEFPGVMFSWTSGKVTATDSSGVNDLFTGMPIWNVYLADLNGDSLPELCATVSIGSGIIDTRVIVYDYANGALYELSDRMLYDYALSLEDGQLAVTQLEYNGGEIAHGRPTIIDHDLTVIGLDRAQP